MHKVLKASLDFIPRSEVAIEDMYTFKCNNRCHIALEMDFISLSTYMQQVLHLLNSILSDAIPT